MVGKSTRSYVTNKSNIDGSQLRLLELSFGLDPSNPLPYLVRVSRLGLFHASPTPPTARADQTNELGLGSGAHSERAKPIFEY